MGVRGAPVHATPERAVHRALREPAWVTVQILQPLWGVAKIDGRHTELVVEPGVGDNDAAEDVRHAVQRRHMAGCQE